MGLLEGLLDQHKYFHNSSKCSTWNDVYASHWVEGKNIKLNFEHILGLVILLSIGLGAALVIFIFENFVHLVQKKVVKRFPTLAMCNFPTRKFFLPRRKNGFP